jgi:signal transduction histidine kinase
VQLLSLIGELLEMTSLKQETLATTVTEFDPRTPIRDAINASKGRRPHVSLEVSQPEIVPMMSSDIRTVTKTLKALIDNAFKFTREGQVCITLSIAGDRVKYAVKDTGVGIAPEMHDLIFDEFRQVDGSRTRAFSGSGLALALARRLARLVHGDITVASAVGVGSTFTLELPLCYDPNKAC